MTVWHEEQSTRTSNSEPGEIMLIATLGLLVKVVHLHAISWRGCNTLV